VISSGHGLHIRGASGDPVPPYCDEVDEARKIVERVADYLGDLGVDVVTIHDDVSTTQDANLHWLVSQHNQQGPHDYDISVHLNAYQQTSSKPMGCEVLYVSQDELAEEVSAAIADAGDFIDRGGKYRGDLYFLNNTNEKALLLETFFCDSKPDCDLYRQNFDLICRAIAETIAGERVEDQPPLPVRPPSSSSVLFEATGRCSWFGGPDDDGVSPSEGLAFIFSYESAPHLFLPDQPSGTTGLARRLNPGVMYVACRWDYDVTPKDMLARPSVQAVVRVGDKEILAWPADWGPHEEKTGRVADLSPALMEALEVGTDDTVTVIYPAP